MIETILGIIIAIIPLFLIFAFKNRLYGFIWIFSSIVSFHLLLALLTQTFHIFTYPIILSANCILAIGSVLFLIKKKTSFRIQAPKVTTILIFLIIIFNLFSAHYLYTGKVNTINGTNEVNGISTKYPYFSDEWNAVSLTKYSIQNNALPVVNPLYKNTPFPNPMFPYFSLIAEIFLLTKTDPLTAFVPLSILFNILICIFTFILLKRFGASNISSALATLSLLYIAVGANLPGLWHLLPMTFGILFLLLALVSAKENLKKLILFASLLSLVFYAPMIIFISPLLFGYFLINRKINKNDLIALLSFAIVGVVAFVIVSLDMKGGLLNKFSSLIIRNNLEPGIPLFKVENILPFWSLLLSIVGLYVVIQKRIIYLSYPTIIGLVFWIVYTQTRTVFLIDYPRVVVIVSLLLTIISAFGLDLILSKLKIKVTEKWAVYFLIIIFAISSAFYTQRDNWQKLSLIIKADGKYIKISPAPPANQYLKDEDIQIFSRFNEKIFLAPAWKGLSIGASTGNFPLESKPATITNRIYSYDAFMKLDCNGKLRAINKYKIDYIYSKNIDCKGLSPIATSSEGYILYKTK